MKEAEAKGEQGTVARLQALKEALDQGDRKAQGVQIMALLSTL